MLTFIKKRSWLRPKSSPIRMDKGKRIDAQAHLAINLQRFPLMTTADTSLESILRHPDVTEGELPGLMEVRSCLTFRILSLM